MSISKRRWVTKGVEKEAWVVRYTDTAGKRRLKTFAKKRDADAFHEQTKTDVRKGLHVADSATVTVAEAGKLWLASCAAHGLEQSTLEQYRQHLDLHIVPHIGAVKLSRVMRPTVRAFQDSMREAGASTAMVRKVTVSLGSILADSQERGLVAHNAVREIRRGKAQGGRQKRKLQVGVDIPTPAEVGAMLGHARPGKWRSVLTVAALTGMRASELRGLRWADVDLKGRLIHVRQRADRYRAIGLPKSEAGQRAIPIGATVVNTLKEWKLACPKGELVFPNADGAPLASAKLASYVLWPPQEAAGLTIETDKRDAEGQPIRSPKYMGMHALRHFYASWCINRKADGGLELPGKVVQERLGHSSITMTMDVYGHLFPSGDNGSELDAAEKALLSAG